MSRSLGQMIDRLVRARAQELHESSVHNNFTGASRHGEEARQACAAIDEAASTVERRVTRLEQHARTTGHGMFE